VIYTCVVMIFANWGFSFFVSVISLIGLVGIYGCSLMIFFELGMSLLSQAQMFIYVVFCLRERFVGFVCFAVLITKEKKRNLDSWIFYSKNLGRQKRGEKVVGQPANPPIDGSKMDRPKTGQTSLF